MFRRLIYAATAVFLMNYTAFQLQALVLQCVLLLIFILLVKPFSEKSQNYREIFNESCILCCSLHLLTFTDFSSDPDIQYSIGWSLIAVTVFNITVNSIIMIIATARELKQKCHKIRAILREMRLKKARIQQMQDKKIDFDSLKKEKNIKTH